MIKPGKKYHGTVAHGSRLYESQNGSMGFQLQLDSEDGPAEYTIWMTPKNKDRAKAAFVDILGVPEESLKDPNYFEYRLAEDIVGRPVTFSTVEEEYNGKKKTKVAFIYKPGSWALAGGTAGQAAASFFDDDIPF